MQQGSDGLNLERMLDVLRRRGPVIFLCFLLAALGAYGFSRHQAKKYTATASLVFNNSQTNLQAAGLQAVSSGGSQLPQQNTNLKLVQLGDMAAKTAGRLGQGLTEEAVRKDLSVSAQGESNIVDVSATAASAELAAEIANTYTKQFVTEQETANHRYYAAALALVNKQVAELSPKQKLSPSGIALAGRAQSLGVLAELHNGNVEIAQAATVPTSPSSPKVSRNTALGAILGLLLGLGIAFLLELADRRIREPKDLESVYGLPLLGVVPESAALSRGGQSGESAQTVLSSSEAEAFHLIRAHMRYFNVDRELRTLMVVSAAPGDGKTTIARHLAAAAAKMGARVLLLEADLRRPTIAQQLGITVGRGLSDVLIGAVSLDEATQTLSLDSRSSDGSKVHVLDVLVAGVTPPPNPGELIESHAMETLLEHAKATYDLIVIDTPPLTAVSDAFPLLKKVDGVVIVGRVGRNRRDVAERLHETLAGAGAPLLGVIANGFKAGRRGSYGYGYGYDYSPTRPPAQPSGPVGSEPSTGGASVSSDDNAASVEEPVPTGNA